MDTLHPMRRLLPLALAVLAAACSSTAGNRPADMPAPLIELSQPSMMFFGSDGSTAVTIDVEILNRAKIPLTVRNVAVSSFAMNDYTLIPAARDVRVEIPPGEKRTVGIVVRAEARNARSQTSEPLSVRAVVRMEANGKGFREVVMQRLTGAGS